MLKTAFSGYTYVSLEDPDTLAYALEDPRGFFSTYQQKIIIDEAQRAPHIFSYLQGIVNSHNQPGQFILSGSQNFLLHRKITQSLAGRVSIHRLFPFDLNELLQAELLAKDWHTAALKGGYPRIYDVDIPASAYYPSYLDSYITRDIEEIVNIRNVALLRNFVRLCAGRAGQILNLSSLATDAGISHTTAREWLTLLEGSYLIFLLPPYFRNFSKRLIKSPKIYFYDTGLLCSLLGIKPDEHLQFHPLRGNIFENMILSDLYKHAYHIGSRPEFYFWRDSNGNEIDVLVEKAGKVDLLEIKSGSTLNSSYFKGFTYFSKVAKDVVDRQALIYTGSEELRRNDTNVIPWHHLHRQLS